MNTRNGITLAAVGTALLGLLSALATMDTPPFWWGAVTSILFGEQDPEEATHPAGVPEPAPVPVTEPGPVPAPDPVTEPGPVPAPVPAPDPVTEPVTVPTATSCVTKTIRAKRIFTDADNARVSAGDSEIDSDDWTRITLTYEIARSPQAIELNLAWVAQELNSNRTKGDTTFKSRKNIPLFRADPSCKVAGIIPQFPMRANRVENYNGQVHDFVTFPDTGALSAIEVRFDGPGRDDHKLQALRAELRGFQVRQSATN